MTNETKKRDPSSPDNLGRPGMARRISEAEVSEPADRKTSGDKTNRVEGPTKSKGGRPSTTGKPWEALGISRQAYYKRQKKEQPK